MDEVRVLRGVVAIAEELSFTRAAERLGVSQPSLSRGVRAFEDVTGIVLFDRTTRLVEVTPAGEALVEHARVALAQLDRGVSAARRVANGEEGTVRLGFVTGAANSLLPGLVTALRRSRPGIRLELEHRSVDEQLEGLRRRRLDVGLVRLPSDVATGRLVVALEVPDRLVAAVPATSALAAGSGPLPWESLQAEPFLFWPREMAPSLHDAVLQHLREQGGLEPHVDFATRDTVALLALVAAGAGVTLVTAGTAAALQRRGVAYRELPDPPAATVAVVHRPGPTSEVQAVVNACRTAADRSITPRSSGTL